MRKETRVCIECDAIYEGDIECPECGGVGEPLVTGSFELEQEYVTTVEDIIPLIKNKIDRNR